MNAASRRHGLPVAVPGRRIAGLVAACALAGCIAGAKLTDLAQGQSGWLSYPSSAEPIRLAGELRLPRAAGRVPAIVIAHGSGGLDERSERWAAFFLEQGYATFKMDYFGPRGVTAQSAEQPVPVNDAFDALRLLATHPRIDPGRIAIIGFSRGAHLAVNAASPGSRDTGGQRFAAHVGLYPTCGLLHVGRERNGAPVLVLVGSDDDIAPAVQCEVLQRSAALNGRVLDLRIYEGARHGWDGDYTGVWFHRALNTSYRMHADPALTERSRQDVLRFLQAAFGS